MPDVVVEDERQPFFLIVRIKLTSRLPFKLCRVHFLIPFRSRGRVGVPLSAALHGSTEILPTQTANFFQIFLRTAKCARLQNANGRKGIKKCIYMIIQFIFMGRNFPGGGRAFFDMSMTVGFCR